MLISAIVKNLPFMSLPPIFIIVLFALHRLFDSQNNNRGGYNVGKLYYYEGSVLPIEWLVHLSLLSYSRQSVLCYFISYLPNVL